MPRQFENFQLAWLEVSGYCLIYIFFHWEEEPVESHVFHRWMTGGIWPRQNWGI